MKSKAILAMAVAGALWSAGAMADEAKKDAYGYDVNSVISGGPLSVSESSTSMSTLDSLDWYTGGYKGWGPMANLQTPSGANESYPLASVEAQQRHQQQVAEVEQARQRVWLANAPLRQDYRAIGATHATTTGVVEFEELRQ